MDASSVLSDDDYDVISNPGLDSSIADLNMVSRPPSEPEPLPDARAKWSTTTLEAEDIQIWTRQMLAAMGASSDAANGRRQSSAEQRTRRVYVDGVFDMFNVGDALQLRQAKLAFPYVHLIVGVFDDGQSKAHGAAPTYPHIERCEVVRHCRWVDEVVPDAPWRIDEQFLLRRRIDYVAFDEGATVDPKYDSVRVKGYDEAKRLGKVILTRKTLGITNPPAHAQSSPDARFLSATPTPRVNEDDDYSPPPPLPISLVPSARPIRHTSPPNKEGPIVEPDDDDDDDDNPPADLFL